MKNCHFFYNTCYYQLNFLQLWLITILAFVFNTDMLGQSRTFYEHGYRIEHYMMKDGLPSIHIGGLCEDNEGYLWIATSRGFVKFDGYSFEIHRLSQNLATNSTKDHLNTIIAGEEGNIWLSTLGGGIIRFNPKTNDFKRFATGNIIHDFVNDFVQDSLNNFWLGALEGIIQLNETDSLIVHKLKTIEATLNPFIDSIKLITPFQESIINPIKGQTVQKPFEIKEKKKVSIVTNSRMNLDEKLLDYGWLENEIGEKIWEIDLTKSVNTGGSFFIHRTNIDFLELEAGKYKLIYNKDNSDIPNLYREGTWKAEEVHLPQWQGIQVLEVNDLAVKKINQKLQKYAEKDGLIEGIGKRVFKDVEGNVWFSGYQLGKIDLQTNTVSYPSNCKLFDNMNNCPYDIGVITDKNKNHLWIGGTKKENGKEAPYLGIYNKKLNTYEEIKTGFLLANLTIRHIYHLTMDKAGNLWIGTDGNGLYQLSPPFIPVDQDEKANLIKFDFNLTENLYGVNGNPTNIYWQYIDRNNNLWIGTQMGGLYKIDLKTLGLTYNDLSAILEEETFLNMVEDPNNQVWIGTRNNCLIQFDGLTKETTLHRQQFKGHSIKHPIAPILTLANKKILFQTPEEFILYNSETDQIDTVVSALIPQLHPLYYGGTTINDSLIFLPPSYIVNYKKWTIFKKFDNYLGGNFFRKSVKGIDGFWLNANYGSLGNFKVNGKNLDTLNILESETRISDILEDGKGEIWVASPYGLQHFQENKQFPINYAKEGEKYLDLMGSLEVDGKGNIWIFTAQGIKKFDRKKQILQKINKLDKIDSARPNHQFSLKNNKGEFRVLGSKGLFTFHPDSIQTDNITPKVIIESLSHSGEQEQELINTFDTNMPYGFNYSQNDLTIKYVGIHFNSSENISYAYQLEGHQKDWQEVGGERTARYANLPSGSYHFNVKAANADGIWSKPKSLIISIFPPWWKTWWAYLLYALTALGALWWYIQNLNKKLQKEQAHSKELQTLNGELADISIANQRFVPNDFLQILGKKGIKDLKLGDQTQTKMTVLFSDIRSYTTLSETMTPEENFRFINAYLGRVGPIIKTYGGFISTYLGDGFMALFVNEPKNAILATIAMQKELNKYNQERKASGKRPLKTGMGLNTGDLMLGVIGDEHRYESTVISDAVNTASRMEGLTKVFGAAIILSERTMAKVEALNFNAPTFAYRYLGKVKVKGKDKALKIYDLYEGETVAIRELKAQTKLQFEQGINHYFNRQFGKSAECFKQVLEVNQTDKAAQYYLDKSVEYIVNGVTEDWSGVEEMVMK